MAVQSTDKEFRDRAIFLTEAQRYGDILGVIVEADWHNNVINFIGDDDMVLKLIEYLEQQFPDQMEC